MIGLLIALTLVSVVESTPATNERWVFEDVDGRTHEPFNDIKTKAIVVVFVTTDCPIANYYQPTLSRFAKEYAAKGVPFFLCHSDPDRQVEEVREHAKEFKTETPVILDSDQQLAKRLKAKVTPEAFVIDRQGQRVYRGRIDDLYADFGKRRRVPKTQDLKDAIDAFLAGKKIEHAEMKAIGCYISYAKGK